MHPLIRSTGLLILLFGVASLAADSNLTGTWNVHIQSSVQTRATTMKLKQEGKTVTGTLSGANGSELPITGTVAGEKISFSYPLTGLRIQNADGTGGGPTELTLRYEGTVQNNQISAKASNSLAGEIVLTAKKQ
jgi:hypothetical protein